MSKFTDRLEMHRTGQRVPMFEPYRFFSESTGLGPHSGFGIGQEWVVGVVFEQRVLIPERATDHEKEICRREAIRSLLHGVFGEFRDDFWKVRAAIVEYDIEKSLQLLSEMENKMFDR